MSYAIKLAYKKIGEAKRLICQNKKCHFIFYQNSKPTASAVIFKGNKVLLAKRAIEPNKNYWDLPGGFLEEGEHPLTGVRREIKEELGVSIKIIKILGIYMDRYLSKYLESTLNIYYLARIKKGKIKPDDDISEARWFAKNTLPKSLAFKSNKEALKDFLKLMR